MRAIAPRRDARFNAMSQSRRKSAQGGGHRGGLRNGGRNGGTKSGGSIWPYLLLILIGLAGWYYVHHQRSVRRNLRTATRTFESGRVAPSRHGRQRGGEGHIAGCGTERWAVKTLMDPDASAISTTPIDTSIENLVAIPRPVASTIPEDGRNPIEEKVYRVHARLLRYKLETDNDIHIVLGSIQDPRVTMVAEIPAGSCTTNQDYGPLFDELRQDLSLRFGPPTPRFHQLPRNTRVVVTGVGFFDFLHGQSGMASNGLELHPVLHLSVQ